MDSRLKKGLFLVTLAGAITIPARGVQASPEVSSGMPSAGIGSVLEECHTSDDNIKVEEYLVPAFKGEYSDMAFANVSSYLYIRSEPCKESEWVGKLYPDYAAKITGPVGEWTQIESGNVKGYVKTEYIYIGKQAEEKAQEIKNAAEENPNTNAEGDEQQSEEAAEQQPEEAAEQQPEEAAEQQPEEAVKQQSEEVDEKQSEESEEQQPEAAAAENDEQQTETDMFSYAESKEEEEKRLAEEQTVIAEEAAANASSGQAVVDYACQFIGNPYVWGGTDLLNGADCSGFVQSVYSHFGVSLPRTSGEQRSAGTGINYEEAQPGDLICYDGHIGIYIGDGQIVNAINSQSGIGISSATYANILAVRRVLY